MSAPKFKFPVAAFFFPEPPELPDIESSFRTLNNEIINELPQRVRYLLRKAKVYQQSLYELNNERNPAQKIIIRDLGISSYNSLEEAIFAVRQYLDISLEQQMSWGSEDQALKAWRSALFDVGVYVFKDSFQSEGICGFCLYDDEFPIIYLNNSVSKTRQIFTIFHELAHLLYSTSGVDLDDKHFLNNLEKEAQKIEIACNKFSSYFLVPNEELLNLQGTKNIDEQLVNEIAKNFNVSREVIYRRFLDQQKISQSQYVEARDKWASQRQVKSGGGDYYRNIVAYLGKDYINLAFDRYYQNKISENELADYLDLKPKQISKLEGYLYEAIS